LLFVVVETVFGAYFLHLTDSHIDLNYKEGANVVCPSWGIGVPCCHPTDIGSGDAGPYGEPSCDAPIKLISEFLNEMRLIYPNPDFIIFTGDAIAHTDVTTFNSKIIDTWEVLYSAILTAFPNKTIYSSMGNHDTFPADLLRPNGEEDIVSDLAAMWATALGDPDAISLASKYGYYSSTPKERPNMRIVSVNIMYTLNGNFEVSDSDPDPAYQKKWLSDTLYDAAAKKQVPLIIIHGTIDGNTKSDWAEWFTALLDELTQKAAITGAPLPTKQLGGHSHWDELQFLRPSLNSTSSNSVMHVTPATSNYNSIWPSIAVHHYDPITLASQDIEMFHVNITRANTERRVTPELFYSATEIWNIPDTTLKSWEKVLERIRTDEKAAQLYNLIYSTDPSLPAQPCDQKCRSSLYCYLAYSTNALRSECLSAEGF